MRRYLLIMLIGILMLSITFVVTTRPALHAQTDQRCFEETGYCIEGRIREYWEQNGGLPVFGLPITAQQAETFEGQTIEAQWFERNRLELHPENAPPYDVLLGRLGVDALEQRGDEWWDFPQQEPQADCRFFEDTGKNVCGDILAAWRAEGLEFDGQPGTSEAESLALFGLPISPAQVEVIDGQELTVQWFERARFELHPENDPPYHVLLGLLGNEVLAGAPIAAPPTETATPEPLPPQPAAWPQITLTDEIGGLLQPVHITHAGDGSGRIFVVEQQGTIQIIRDGAKLAVPFLDITDRVRSGGERGLLSVAFPPDYASKGYFYIDYTDLDGNTVIARYRLSDNPDIADPASEEVLLFIEQPYANHNGGQLAFGPDGYLYIGMGDGGSGGDPDNRAQDTGDLLGKILRIDVEAGATPYAIPPDNPFVGMAGTREEIWALGMRNPWRFSFDAQTGDLFIADVGELTYEEVNVEPAGSSGGLNYGWNIMEGSHCFNPPEGCDTSGLVLPVVEYDHSEGDCSITGGCVYRGGEFARMNGIYFYADYCSGKIWGLRRNGDSWENRLLYEAPFPITSFGADQSGTMYVTDFTSGIIYKLADTRSG